MPSNLNEVDMYIRLLESSRNRLKEILEEIVEYAEKLKKAADKEINELR